MTSILTIGDLQQAQATNPGLIEELLSKVAVQGDLERYLNWLIENEQTTRVITTLKRKKKRTAGIHPSSACKKAVCLLKLYNDCTEKVAPLSSQDFRSQQTWDLGTFLHELHQTYFEEMYGDQFQKEVSLHDPNLHIWSHADGLFSFTRLRIVLEMKSIKEGGNYGWEKVQQKPFDDNVRQTNFYMKVADVPFGLILYINKNSGGLYKEHAVTFNQTMWDEVQTGVVEPVINAAYKDGPMVPASPSWNCKQCDYAHACPHVMRRKSNGSSTKRAW